ncbi:tetrahydrofolate dehydrogenase/cyclohydrolase catalytic domain-containing protein, partial [Arthrobacter sp. Cr_A7]|uniref:bifunctional 5,10-methylenetetrahydrofolate dehydrogenase/5,10-methenyltetrahydrofolate cyclohydrolase n=1 Tax=Arthrobacter sp. Cr_A7 TaxID=3031017 RepID=UPI0023D9AF64
MTAELIDGKQIAADIRAEVAAKAATLKIRPGLATLLVGEDPASGVYVQSKRRLCTQAGMRDLHQHFPSDVSESELLAVIHDLNSDPGVDGILLQLPLPEHLDANALVSAIDPEKDVDGLTETSAGRLALGQPGLQPCTPSGVIELLERSGVAISGAHAVVVGRSLLVGRPQAQLLLAKDATVTMCHSRTRHLADHTRRADILIAAAGV